MRQFSYTENGGGNYQFLLADTRFLTGPASAISDNRDGVKLNHERRDNNRLHVRIVRAGLLYRD
jgi:hypothetical protein